jgi:hypothetical protein
VPIAHSPSPHPALPLDLESLLGPTPSLIGKREDYERIYENVDADFQKLSAGAAVDTISPKRASSPDSGNEPTRSKASAGRRVPASGLPSSDDSSFTAPAGSSLLSKRGRKPGVSSSGTPLSTVPAETSVDFINFNTRLSPDLANRFKIRCRQLNGQSLLADELSMSAFCRALIVLFLNDESLREKALALLSKDSDVLK